MNEPYPELCQGVLDSEMLASWVRDVLALANVLSVSAKGDPTTHAGASGLSLLEAAEQLRTRKLRGVQVHYVWNEQAWLDTLINNGEEIRLVRRRC